MTYQIGQDLSEGQKTQLFYLVNQMLDREMHILKKNGYENVGNMVVLAKNEVNAKLDKIITQWEDHQLTVEANREAREKHNKEIQS